MDQVSKIVGWIKEIYGDRPALVAVSGGVDSAVVLTLLVRALGVDRVIPLALPYKRQDMTDAREIIEWNGLRTKLIEVNIEKMVDEVANRIKVEEGSLRKGNVMARMRMIVLFDQAKKLGALVCGTENKSEHYLGYFTRYGDAASDVEPIVGLYKTEVWNMAKMLGLPEIYYVKKPSAGLWDGQTDEADLGFDYRSADKVLKLLIDQELKDVTEIARRLKEEVDEETVKKVLAMVGVNAFKRAVPYAMR